jgi:hypothetical protein
MYSTAPQIGFDRLVQLDWAAAAIKVRAGKLSLEALGELLDGAGLGKEATAKTRTKLNALFLEPHQSLADFAEQGIQLCKKGDNHSVAVVSWGMAIVSYPFFGKVAEFTGRLTSIQGDCSSLEIHRRMSEVFGDREVTKRATQAVLQTQANWGAIGRVEKGKRLVRLAPMALPSEKIVAWLVEAAVRYAGKALPVSTLKSHPVLYPFELGQSLSYVISNSPALDLRSEGSGNQFVALHAFK